MIRFLFRKYPFSTTALKHILLGGALVSLILFVFQPFGFHLYTASKLVVSLGFGVITIFCLFICNWFVKRSLHKFFNCKWTILKEILYIFLILIVISLSNLCYLSLIIDGFQINSWSFLYTFLLTCAIGIFPTVGLVLLRYNKTLKTNLNKIIQEGRNSEITETNRSIIFENLNKTEQDFRLEENDFLFLEAIKNHIHIYYLDEDRVKTTSIRNTLTNIIEQIDSDNVFQCHRSFLINLNKIKTAKGNSNGYKIYLNEYDQTIPVSRKYTAEFQNIIY